MNKKLLGYYDYTVLLTYCGLLLAFWGILRAITKDYNTAILCLIFAGVCDMFDGAVASTKNREERAKRFGIQIDSLCDLISFGVLPGIFVCMISECSISAEITAALYVLCALIRLAYFNVLEEDRQKQTSEKRKSYLGVPVTTMSVFLPIVYLLYIKGICKTPACFLVTLLAAGAGFLLPIEVPKI